MTAEVTLTIKVVVHDEAKLVEYAKAVYQMAWDDAEWVPADIGEAVLEALVLSNENPSPDEYGIDLEDWNVTVKEVPE